MPEFSTRSPVVIVVVGATLPQLQEHGHDQQVQEAEDDVDVEEVDVEVAIQDQLDDAETGRKMKKWRPFLV